MCEDPSRCSGGIATPLRPPAGLTLDQLTRRSIPLTFAGRALTNGPLHLVVIGQPMGTLRNKVRDQPTTGSPPCRPDTAVSPLQAPATAPSMKGVTLRSRVPGVCTRHRTSRRVRGPTAISSDIATPRRPRTTPVDMRGTIRKEEFFHILRHLKNL